MIGVGWHPDGEQVFKGAISNYICTIIDASLNKPISHEKFLAFVTKLLLETLDDYRESWVDEVEVLDTKVNEEERTLDLTLLLPGTIEKSTIKGIITRGEDNE